jgi:hypothetical protein
LPGANTFTVTTSGSSPIYKWQVNTNGSGWVDLINKHSIPKELIWQILLLLQFTPKWMAKYRARVTAGSPL